MRVAYLFDVGVRTVKTVSVTIGTAEQGKMSGVEKWDPAVESNITEGKRLSKLTSISEKLFSLRKLEIDNGVNGAWVCTRQASYELKKKHSGVYRRNRHSTMTLVRPVSPHSIKLCDVRVDYLQLSKLVHEGVVFAHGSNSEANPEPCANHYYFLRVNPVERKIIGTGELISK
ncbi:hypothetical protein ScPMuIL_004451 [Solemya velum]